MKRSLILGVGWAVIAAALTGPSARATEIFGEGELELYSPDGGIREARSIKRSLDAAKKAARSSEKLASALGNLRENLRSPKALQDSWIRQFPEIAPEAFRARVTALIEAPHVSEDVKVSGARLLARLAAQDVTPAGVRQACEDKLFRMLAETPVDRFRDHLNHSRLYWEVLSGIGELGSVGRLGPGAAAKLIAQYRRLQNGVDGQARDPVLLPCLVGAMGKIRPKPPAIRALLLSIAKNRARSFLNRRWAAILGLESAAEEDAVRTALLKIVNDKTDEPWARIAAVDALLGQRNDSPPPFSFSFRRRTTALRRPEIKDALMAVSRERSQGGDHGRLIAKVKTVLGGDYGGEAHAPRGASPATGGNPVTHKAEPGPGAEPPET